MPAAPPGKRPGHGQVEFPEFNGPRSGFQVGDPRLESLLDPGLHPVRFGPYSWTFVRSKGSQAPEDTRYPALSPAQVLDPKSLQLVRFCGRTDRLESFLFQGL